MKCITSGRFTMWATVLRSSDNINNPDYPNDVGEWVENQDPLTGEITRIWVPVVVQPDDPLTPENEEAILEISCLVRGIANGGVRVNGSAENFGELYENIEYIKLWTHPKYKLNKRDRITNIRSTKNGLAIWRDRDTNNPIRFDINGVVPLMDPFNNHIEDFCLLERAEVNES